MGEPGTRTNQRLRTRKDLLRAAAELLREGRHPTMDDVAERALVSRATAYRYFPTLEALLVEAPLDGQVPTGKEAFGRDAPDDPEERALRAGSILHDILVRNEKQLRLSLAQSLMYSRTDKREKGLPIRQNRRSELIEAALAPVRSQMNRKTYERLCTTLAMLLGIEGLVVLRDVVRKSEGEGTATKDWAVRALVRAAMSEKKSGG